jgi:phage shock protein B
MTSVFIVAIIFGSIVVALGIIGGTILMGIKMRRSGFSHRNRQNEADEARMIQEIYSGLSRLEERVESLETILMDRQGKDQQQ